MSEAPSTDYQKLEYKDVFEESYEVDVIDSEGNKICELAYEAERFGHKMEVKSLELRANEGKVDVTALLRSGGMRALSVSEGENMQNNDSIELQSLRDIFELGALSHEFRHLQQATSEDSRISSLRNGFRLPGLESTQGHLEREDPNLDECQLAFSNFPGFKEYCGASPIFRITPYF